MSHQEQEAPPQRRGFNFKIEKDFAFYPPRKPFATQVQEPLKSPVQMNSGTVDPSPQKTLQKFSNDRSSTARRSQVRALCTVDQSTQEPLESQVQMNSGTVDPSPQKTSLKFLFERNIADRDSQIPPCRKSEQ